MTTTRMNNPVKKRSSTSKRTTNGFVIARYPDAPLILYKTTESEKAISDFHALTENDEIKGMILKEFSTGKVILHYAKGRGITRKTEGSFSSPSKHSPTEKLKLKNVQITRRIFNMPGCNNNF